MDFGKLNINRNEFIVITDVLYGITNRCPLKASQKYNCDSLGLLGVDHFTRIHQILRRNDDDDKP